MLFLAIDVRTCGGTSDFDDLKQCTVSFIDFVLHWNMGGRIQLILNVYAHFHHCGWYDLYFTKLFNSLCYSSCHSDYNIKTLGSTGPNVYYCPVKAIFFSPLRTGKKSRYKYDRNWQSLVLIYAKESGFGDDVLFWKVVLLQYCLLFFFPLPNSPKRMKRTNHFQVT